MYTRLFEIIKYKTGGKQTDFAMLLGWTPQYLTKLLKGKNFGIQPILAIVMRFPEINARWLLTGGGEMIISVKYDDIRKKMHDSISKLLDMEKYMPVMSPEELREFEMIVSGKRKADFSPETVGKWEVLLQQRDEEINARFKAANSKSKGLCKTRKESK
ncbi:MAG: hypothetical protein LBG18_07790 [Mediterranea sp.]|jgi:hypothetical protein|nr:hypothetical protein [Mediterranea sp.]